MSDHNESPPATYVDARNEPAHADRIGTGARHRCATVVRCANVVCLGHVTPSASNPLEYCAACRVRFFGESR